MKVLRLSTGFTLALAISCGSKYEGEITCKTNIPYMVENISTIQLKINAVTERQAKIDFVTQATIYSNISSDIRLQFISGKLLKNGRSIGYELDKKTIDSINLSIEN